MTKAQRIILGRRAERLSRLSAELADMANEAALHLDADVALLIEQAGMKLASASACYFDTIETATS